MKSIGILMEIKGKHMRKTSVSKKQLIEANQVQSKGFVSVCVCVGAEISGALQLD